ncbi:MAG: polysaccharide deacetylase family protein [Aquihabitans sp.]
MAGHDIGFPGERDPAVFGQLLRALSDEAELVRVEDAVARVKAGQVVDHPVIAFTFDDGFLECYQHLAPALHDVGVNAAFFINTRYVDASPDSIERFNRRVNSPGRLPMSSTMVAELADEGFVIGAHTGDHQRLDTADPAVLSDQIVMGRTEVEEITGKPCPWFAWPFGTYNDMCDASIAVALDTYDTVFSSACNEQYSSHRGKILNRRHFEVYWPASHVRYFLRQPRVWEEGSPPSLTNHS